MRIPPTALTLVFVVLFCVCSADAATQEEVQQLQAEIALLKMKLESAEDKVAKASEDVTASNSENQREPRKRPIGDLTEILKTFPSEAQPDRNGKWSNMAAAEAHERLQYAVWGTPFLRDLEIRTVTVKQNPQLMNDADASPWLIEIYFKNEIVEYAGASIKQNVASLKIYADDRRADRARKLEIGDEIKIRGNIVSIRPATLGQLTYTNPSFYFYLRDVKIPGITK